MHGMPDHDDAVRVDDIDRRLPSEGLRIELLLDVRVIIDDGDGIVIEVLIPAVGLWTRKYEHLRFTRQGSVHDEVVSGLDLRARIALQSEIALRTVEGHIASVRRDEVEAGEAGLLLRLSEIGPNLFLIRHRPKIGRPHMKIGHVLIDECIQCLVRLMINLAEVRHTLLIHRLRHELIVTDASTRHTPKEEEEEEERNHVSDTSFSFTFYFFHIFFH